MPFWKCYYHLIWATHKREMLITPSAEALINAAIKQRCSESRCDLLAVNGISDHIHVAISIPPSISVSEMVKLLKGTSSHAVNQSLATLDSATPRFKWQAGFGVLTFGEKVKDTVVQYVLRQKQHHETNTTLSYLEMFDI